MPAVVPSARSVPKMISAVRKSVNVPLIVGGGINTSQKAFNALEAGADFDWQCP
jgi:imidazole glycerol phosphate synthase subunit HisF